MWCGNDPAKNQTKKPMTINQAIEQAAQYFASAGDFFPSHCDVRCLINDMTQDNQRIARDGYNQDLAFKRVRNILKSIRLASPILKRTQLASFFQQ
jgi:hypothetical protein